MKRLILIVAMVTALMASTAAAALAHEPDFTGDPRTSPISGICDHLIWHEVTLDPCPVDGALGQF